jgi:hypothetical protein
MKFYIHANAVPWQQEYLPRFVAGLAAHGHQVIHTTEDKAMEDGVNIIFANNSWKLTHQQCINKKIPILTVGRCFFGSRFDMVAIGWDGFNGSADFCLEDDMPEDRWLKHGWELTTDVINQVNSNEDGYVLVCGEFRDMGGWYVKTALDLHGEKVRFRPHPFKKDIRVSGWQNARDVGQDSIHELFPECRAVVTYDSIAGCDAALAGVPTICYGENAMARPVAFHDWRDFLDMSREFELERWARRLAFCQWSHDEIAGGEWWPHLEAGLSDRAARASEHAHLSRTTRMRRHHRLLGWK